MNTANKLTMIRVVLIPVFIVLLYLGYMLPALAVFIVASITDFVDGYVARKSNLITYFGKFMDWFMEKVTGGRY